MKRSTERILVTHAGTLPQPADLKEMLDAKNEGKPYDHEAYSRRVRSAVAEGVRQQVDCGVDIVNDGELGKPNFSRYTRERLSGFVEKPAGPIFGRLPYSAETWRNFPITLTREDALPSGIMHGSFTATSLSSTSAMPPSKPTSTTSKPRSKASRSKRPFCRRWLPGPWSTG